MKNLYVVSIVAMKLKETGWTVDQDALATLSSSHKYAREAGLEKALAVWPLSEGWINHGAYASEIERESAMAIPTRLSEESSDEAEETEFIM